MKTNKVEPSNTQPIREIRKDQTTFGNGTTSGKIKEAHCPAGVFIIFIMPFKNNTYFARGAFSHHVVTRQSLASYDRARDSTCQYPRPYPSPAAITLRMESGEEWYAHAGRDLHLVDLLFQAHIQTAHRMSQWVDRFPNWDRVLERLMAEGLFDRWEPDHVHIAEVHANWLSVALTERVLERVENLEGRVSLLSFDAPSTLILGLV